MSDNNNKVVVKGADGKKPGNKPQKKQKLSLYEEEKVQSPLRTMMRLFFTRKLTILGLGVFSFILLGCIILPFFFPADLSFSDSTQINLPPGFHFQNFPKELDGKAKLVSVGNNFAVGVDTSNKVYVWGNLHDSLKNIPQDMGNIVQVSAGLTQIIALNDQGDVFSWGNDPAGVWGLFKIPQAVQDAHIVQVFAGDQISAGVDDTGRLYTWGNENIVIIRAGSVQGRIEKVLMNNVTGIALLDDKSVAPLIVTSTSPFYSVPEDIQGRVVDVALNDFAAAALLDDGTVRVWGVQRYGLYDVPEDIQGHVVSLSGGRAHFTALLDDGSVDGWGFDIFGQASAPNVDDVAMVQSGYYQSYAIGEDGSLTSWGLRGYIFGTDDRGRDVFSRLLAGGRISLSVGALSVVIASIVGIIIGSISGYFGGITDVLLMRLAEIWAAVPFLPIAIILTYILAGRMDDIGRIIVTMVILGLLTWPGIARLVRAQMLAARENDYVLAAKSIGVQTRNVIFRHIFPNILTIVAVNLMLSLAGSILSESSLSFLGVGIRDPIPTWGNMLNSCVNSQVIKNYWWRWVFPSLTLGLSTLSLNIVGDGLREAIDPKSAGR